MEDISELVKYAHKFYVKVMVTVNTIIKDEEISQVKKMITELYNIGVDSIIIQDMAIIKWAIDGEIPPIQLHISTQCDNRLPEKIKFFRDMGLPRVVLARELSKETISNIIKNNPGIEIETFVHGALCVSYSGQCYMSRYIGGRSANRGECAQPCRKKYTVTNEKGEVLVKDKHVLSLKDFCADSELEELVKMGVKSFKIEGRLKDINYVKNVVSYYRERLDKISDKTSSGRTISRFTPDINKTFNRGYTTYFLNGRENCFNFDSPKFIGFKIKTNQILSPQDGLTFDKTGEIGCLINRVDNDSAYSVIYPNIMPKIKSGMFVYRNSDVKFENELKNSKTKRQIGVNVEYREYNLCVKDEDGNEAVISVTEREQAKNYEKNKENFIKSLSKTGEEDFYIKSIDLDSKVPFLPVSKMNEYRRELFHKLMSVRLDNYKYERQKDLHYVPYSVKELDYRANVYNKDSVDFYKNCGATVNEYAFEKTGNAKELMRTKHCIKYALNMCKSPDKLYLTDDRGERFNLIFDCKNCEMIISK